MSASTKTSIYENLLEIMTDYLGPAGDRFLKRQIEFHLKKDPQTITSADLVQFKEWVKVSLALLTEDRKLVDQCIRRIE